MLDLSRVQPGSRCESGHALLTNGQDRGNNFPDTVPPNGTLELEITLDGAGLFAGNVTIYAPDPSCAARLSAKGAYWCRSVSDGRLEEVFSFRPAKSAPLGSCTTGAVNFDPDGSDSSSRIPGFAFVGNPPSDPLPQGTELCLRLYDNGGTLIDGPNCFPFTGKRQVGLLNDFFPSQEPFQGSFEVCSQGENRDLSVNTLMIEVDQSGSDVQLSTIPQIIKNLECTPHKNALCLLDDRFQVVVVWNDGSSLGLGQAVSLDNSSGLFYFLDPNDIDLVIQMLDGCTDNNNFWVFFASTATNVEYTLTVTDTGQTKSYDNPLGQLVLSTIIF